ncbi:MAG: c-type cytochrome [Actinomycetota bacterium]|nr:MAG: c-type cytochrome [Actinomycetota bacterium]
MKLHRKSRRQTLVPLVLGIAASVSGLAIFSQTASASTSNSVSSLQGANSVTYEGTKGANKAPITQLKLNPSTIALGKTLFVESCASCHGDAAVGTSRAPNLQGLGAATIDFWVSTGRMPLADPTVQPIRKPPRFSRSQTLAIDAYVTSLASGGPHIPQVNLGAASLSAGEGLFATNCAACHTITGVGDALANSVYAPSLHNASTTQIAEAIRTGPLNMPRFGTGNLSNQQVADITKYVKNVIQHPNDVGGLGLGWVGPVAEGFVAILIGLGVLMIAGYWIGGRAHE